MHTSGPWTVDETINESRQCGGIWVKGPDRCHICDIFPFGNRMNTRKPSVEECIANARLIAAAPDMLSALELVWNKVLSEYHAKDSYVRQQVEAAIAKAAP